MLAFPSAAGAATVKGDVSVSTVGGYARIIFTLAEDVEADVRLAGGILIVQFKQPVDVPVQRIPTLAVGYVAAARSDPDGTGVRMALNRKVTVNSMAAGEKLFVDLLPEGWVGLAPGLPQEVVEELSRRARDAEKKARQQLLAVFLRARKANAGITYMEMAEGVERLPSAATFKRSASGASVPAWETVEFFVLMTMTKEEAFNGDVKVALHRAKELWVRARRATRAPRYVHMAPDPDLISDKADCSRALRDLHAWAGAPSPREMEAAAGRHGELPYTTAYRIINGQSLPVSRQQTLAYLLACHLDPAEVRRWITAFIRIEFLETSLFFWKTTWNNMVEGAEPSRSAA